ncbi:ABC transporter permease [Leucobacter soli]|uniref:ABC transmembrane type-1 domain-containing protein n=1 Tax=Leucobacter soli TaxID=2812850 RepID=A0A916JY29_9MICO|nr:ABC transporter permease [Leucobacter soli]CAG7610258.1 hypothetical protein LEUCIP111803_01284 [Leucobacter soli]
MTSAPASAGVARTARPRPRRRLDGWALASLPGLAFLGVFFVWPLIQVLMKSLGDPLLANYSAFFSSSGYVAILGQTFQIAAMVTVSCALLGYPYAYLMSRVGSLARIVLIGVVLLPVWTSFLVRSVALQTWLQDTGVINTVLQSLGLIDAPLPLIRNTFGVTVGMTQILLPFMILPLFSVMLRVRPELIPAARSLGATPVQAFFRVFLPQTFPGLMSGGLLVFVTALGFFIVPAILGGTDGSMLSKLIVDLIGRNQLGLAAAMATVLLAITALLLGLGSRFVRIREMVGGR